MPSKEITVDGLSGQGTPAKSFYGYSNQMGDTYEVWIIHDG
jgi:hypothetical protein